MRITRLIIILAFILSITTGCIDEWDQALETRTVDNEIIDASDNFNSKTFDFDLEVYKKELALRLTINLPRDFEFPFDSTETKELVNTTFYFDFMQDGKIIEVDNNLLSYYKHSLIDSKGTVSFKSKLENINVKQKINMDIPLYIFHNLKPGNQKIQMKVYQKHFQNTESYNYQTEEYDSVTIVMDRKLWGTIEFELKIPEIFKTELFSDSIVLRDDETFSPKGMDFSFRSGYPDIYWELYYPTSTKYFKSAEANYATAYYYRDTISLYHYGKSHDIKIGVYDRDDLSKDDVIGTWEGSVNEIRGENYSVLEFDNITKFYIKANKKDIPVN